MYSLVKTYKNSAAKVMDWQLQINKKIEPKNKIYAHKTKSCKDYIQKCLVIQIKGSLFEAL